MNKENNEVYQYHSGLNIIYKEFNSEFFQSIIEKENEIQLNGNPNEENIKELAGLYKNAIENYSGISNEKVIFYNNKLTKLIMAVQKNKKKKNSKPSYWSQYINKHKKYANKIMLFFKLESNKSVINNMFDKLNNNLNNGIYTLRKNLFDQSKKFFEKKQIKINKLIEEYKNNNSENKIYINLPKSDTIETILKDFLKKFHYIYMHSKIFEIPIETLSQIFDDLYYHKINKYFYYQEQIKQFDLFLNDDDENNEHDESIQFFLKDLTTERKQYFDEIEELINKIKLYINQKCSNINIEKEYYINKYKNEFMNSIEKIFS